jgi:ribosomal protein S18 acetylase RimI-like enzyme
MLFFTRIEKSNEIPKEAITLYKESFPVEERRSIEQLSNVVDTDKRCRFNVVWIEDKGLPPQPKLLLQPNKQFAGFFIYWKLASPAEAADSGSSFFYLEHFAVNPQFRNKGIGAEVLKEEARSLQGLRLLEVEPSTNELTARRIKFYERNGYQVLDKTYIQPSYSGSTPEIPLWIMGSQNLATTELKPYIKQIKTVVYRI